MCAAIFNLTESLGAAGCRKKSPPFNLTTNIPHIPKLEDAPLENLPEKWSWFEVAKQMNFERFPIDYLRYWKGCLRRAAAVGMAEAEKEGCSATRRLGSRGHLRYVEATTEARKRIVNSERNILRMLKYISEL
jgi:hypothetical protein